MAVIGLITQRSLVQIQPPPRAFCVPDLDLCPGQFASGHEQDTRDTEERLGVPRLPEHAAA